MVIYPIGSTKACTVCADILSKSGICVVDHPTPEITHLLLDVPGFTQEGVLRNGQRIEKYLPMLPQNVTVIGGNLKHEALSDYPCVDLLVCETYLAQNAAITAECALQVAAAQMDVTFRGCHVLIIGWGRIGKCLCQILKALGSHVTVAARRESDRAMAQALGYHTVSPEKIPSILRDTTLLINTVPGKILQQSIPKECTAIELASVDGISGENVITARGLPGKYAPASSGKLIAETILSLYKEGSL